MPTLLNFIIVFGILWIGSLPSAVPFSSRFIVFLSPRPPSQISKSDPASQASFPTVPCECLPKLVEFQASNDTKAQDNHRGSRVFFTYACFEADEALNQASVPSADPI